MTVVKPQTRRANPGDAEAIVLAHLDSIRSIGPAFYPADIVEAWSAGLTPDIYIKAMESGEAFFIATDHIDGLIRMFDKRQQTERLVRFTTRLDKHTGRRLGRTVARILTIP